MQGTAFARAALQVIEQGHGWVPGLCCAELGLGEVLPPDSEGVEFDRQSDVQWGCTERRMAALLGPTLDCTVALVYRSCAHNECEALRRRVAEPGLLWHNPEVQERWIRTQRRMRGDLKALYWQRMRGQVASAVQPTPLETWLSSYSAGQRETLRLGRDDASRFGSQWLPPSFWRIKAFLKVELTPMLLTTLEVKLPKPRLIQGRAPQITATCGPTMSAIGKLLQYALPLGRPGQQSDWAEAPIAYVGGASAEEIGAWYGACVDMGLEPDPLDIVSYDASNGPGAHRAWAADVLDLGVGPMPRALVRRRIDTPQAGRTRFGIRYSMLCEIASGDSDTTAEGTNNHAKVWAVLLGPQPVARVALAGDNAVLMRPSGTRALWAERIQRVFGEHGFRAGLESDEEGWYAGQLCSGRLWAVGDSWVYGPKIGRILAKTFWMVHPPAERKWVNHLKGVCVGLSFNVSHIPVLRAVVHTILDRLRDVQAERVSNPAAEPWKIWASHPSEATQETFDQMSFLYGCTREEVLALEGRLAQLPLHQPTVLREPLLRRIAAVDLGRPDE